MSFGGDPSEISEAAQDAADEMTDDEEPTESDTQETEQEPVADDPFGGVGGIGGVPGIGPDPDQTETDANSGSSETESVAENPPDLGVDNSPSVPDLEESDSTTDIEQDTYDSTETDTLPAPGVEEGVESITEDDDGATSGAGGGQSDGASDGAGGFPEPSDGDSTDAEADADVGVGDGDTSESVAEDPPNLGVDEETPDVPDFDDPESDTQDSADGESVAENPPDLGVDDSPSVPDLEDDPESDTEDSADGESVAEDPPDLGVDNSPSVPDSPTGTDDSSSGSSGPQTPEGTPPNPDEGPSPSPDSGGPNIPDAGQTERETEDESGEVVDPSSDRAQDVFERARNDIGYFAPGRSDSQNDTGPDVDPVEDVTGIATGSPFFEFDESIDSDTDTETDSSGESVAEDPPDLGVGENTPSVPELDESETTTDIEQDTDDSTGTDTLPAPGVEEGVESITEDDDGATSGAGGGQSDGASDGAGGFPEPSDGDSTDAEADADVGVGGGDTSESVAEDPPNLGVDEETPDVPDIDESDSGTGSQSDQSETAQSDSTDSGSGPTQPDESGIDVPQGDLEAPSLNNPLTDVQTVDDLSTDEIQQRIADETPGLSKPEVSVSRENGQLQYDVNRAINNPLQDDSVNVADLSDEVVKQRVADANEGIRKQDVSVERTESGGVRFSAQQQLGNPFDDVGVRGLSNQEVKQRVAEANPGLSEDDVVVERTERGGVRFETDLDGQDARELVAAQNDVRAEQVTFTEDGPALRSERTTETVESIANTAVGGAASAVETFNIDLSGEAEGQSLAEDPPTLGLGEVSAEQQADESKTSTDESQSEEGIPSDEEIRELAETSDWTEEEIRRVINRETGRDGIPQGDVSTDGPTVDELIETDNPTEDTVNRSGQTTSRAAPGQNTPLFDIDSEIADDLTSGGLLGEGTKELDEPTVTNPFGNENPGDLSEDDIKERVADANPGLSKDDVVVERTEDGGVRYRTDIDGQTARELVAAQNEGVSADDVAFTEDGPVERQGGFDLSEGEVVPNEVDLQRASQGFNQGVNVVGEVTGEVTNIVTAPTNPDAAVESAQDLASGDLEEIQSEDGETRTEGVVEGVVIDLGKLGNVPGYALTAESAVEASGGILANAPSQPGQTAETTAALGSQLLRQSGEQFIESVREDPAEAVGGLIGGIAGGVAIGTVASPLRVTRRNVPVTRTTEVDVDTSRQTAAEGVDADDATTTTQVTETTDSQSLTGVRVTTPPAAEYLGVRRRGTTIAGARGKRPTVGAPSLEGDAANLDLSRTGATPTGTKEPESAFETDVFRATARDAGDTEGQKFESVENVQDEATDADAEFTVDSAEEAIGNARAVPDSATEEVTQALRDTDATVFGSAAARAQTEDFRQPRDLDVVVDDKQAAKQRFSEALEGEDATVNDVFDIKETEDVPGRARAGEEIKFGRTSQAPRELDGVPFNPVEEELIRKSGASAFLRQPGAAGTDDLDVGPEPRRAGRTDVREKDVQDTADLAEELGVSGSTQQQFAQAFDLDRAATPQQTGGLQIRQSLRDLLADTRAQAGTGRVRRTNSDSDTDSTTRADTDEIETTDGPKEPIVFGGRKADTDTDTDTTTSRDSDTEAGRRADADVDRSRTTETDTTSPPRDGEARTARTTGSRETADSTRRVDETESSPGSGTDGETNVGPGFGPSPGSGFPAVPESDAGVPSGTGGRDEPVTNPPNTGVPGLGPSPGTGESGGPGFGGGGSGEDSGGSGLIPGSGGGPGDVPDGILISGGGPGGGGGPSFGGGGGGSPADGSPSGGGAGSPGGGSPGGSGGIPGFGDTTRRRPRFRDDETDEDEDEFATLFGRAENPVGADFLNPLTGGVLETDLNVGDVDLED